MEIYRNPSIDSNTHFEASSPNRIVYGDVSNAKTTPVRSGIREQVHYDTWIQAENIYNWLIDTLDNGF